MENVENNKENISEIEMEKEEARKFIGFIKQQCGVMGANDSEINDLERLEKELMANEISPEDSRKQAQGILNSKQDYH